MSENIEDLMSLKAELDEQSRKIEAEKILLEQRKTDIESKTDADADLRVSYARLADDYRLGQEAWATREAELERQREAAIQQRNDEADRHMANQIRLREASEVAAKFYTSAQNERALRLTAEGKALVLEDVKRDRERQIDGLKKIVLAKSYEAEKAAAHLHEAVVVIKKQERMIEDMKAEIRRLGAALGHRGRRN